MSAHDTLVPTPVRPRHGRAQLAEDLRHVVGGRLDLGSLLDSYRRQVNPVEVRTTSLVPDGVKLSRFELVADPTAFSAAGAVWDPLDRVWRDQNYGMQRRAWREIRRTHNTRLNVGRDQVQRIGIFGDVGSSLNGLLMAYTGSTSTSLTGASGLPTTTSAAGNAGLQGHVIYVPNATAANSVIGVIVSNSSTAPTVDQWYALPLTGAAGTTPANSAGTAFVLPGSSWPWWVALSTSSSAPAAADVTRTADGLWGDGTGSGAATEQTANGLARAYVGQGGGTAPTIPGAGQVALNHTWTYSGSTLVTIPKVVMFNSLAAAGTIPMLETLLNAQATVNTSGDTIQLASWTVTF